MRSPADSLTETSQSLSWCITFRLDNSFSQFGSTKYQHSWSEGLNFVYVRRRPYHWSFSSQPSIDAIPRNEVPMYPQTRRCWLGPVAVYFVRTSESPNEEPELKPWGWGTGRMAPRTVRHSLWTGHPPLNWSSICQRERPRSSNS